MMDLACKKRSCIFFRKKNISNRCLDDNERDNDDDSVYNKTIFDDGGNDGNDLSKKSQTSALISLAK